MKSKLSPRTLTDNLIGYCRIGKKWDTPLDALDVQKNRMEKWATERGYVIQSWVIDDGCSGDVLYMAYDEAFEANSQVLVASACRVADSTEEFLDMFKNEATPLLTTETPGKYKGSLPMMAGFTEMMVMSQRQYYNELCEEFLN